MPTKTTTAFTFTFDRMTALSQDLLLTVGLVAGLWVLATLVGWAAARRKSLESQRFWRSTFRNGAALCFLVGMFGIWREQLQSVLVAMGAVTAALLIGFREYFMALLGFWLLMVRRTFHVGDFIEVDGVRGEVLELRWQSTLLAETGPGRDTHHYTGRKVQVPNHLLLTHKVLVDNITGEYGAHLIRIPVSPGLDILCAQRVLLAEATTACESFQKDARAHMAQMRKAFAIDTPSVEPKCAIRYDEHGRPFLQLRLVAPVREKQRVEQTILQRYLEVMGPIAPAI